MDHTNLLESKIHYFTSFQDISDFLGTTDANVPQKISNEFVHYFHRLIDQAIRGGSLNDVAVLVQVMIHLLKQNQSSSIQMLISCKLHNKFGLLLGYAVDQISTRRGAAHLGDQLSMTTLNVIIEYSKRMDDDCLWFFQNMLQRFLEIITEKSIFHAIRSQTVELLLGIFSDDNMQVITIMRQHISQDEVTFDQLCEKAIQDLSQTGDFQLQECTVELLFRMWPTAVRKQKASKWFNGKQHLVSKFLAIEYNKFDYGARMFLNEVNSACHRRRVLTLNYKELQVGSQTLKPSNQWCNCVDFCYESKVLDVRYPYEEQSGTHKCKWNTNTIKETDLISFDAIENTSSKTIDLHFSFDEFTSHMLNDFTLDDGIATNLVIRFYRVTPLDAQYVIKFASALFGTKYAESNSQRHHSNRRPSSSSDDPVPMPPKRILSKSSTQFLSQAPLDRPRVSLDSRTSGHVAGQHKMMNNLAIHSINDGSLNQTSGTLRRSSQCLPSPSVPAQIPISAPSSISTRHISTRVLTRRAAEKISIHKTSEAMSQCAKLNKSGSGEVHRPSEVLTRRSRLESTRSHTPKPSERPSRVVYTSVSKTSKNVSSKKQSEAPIHVSSEEDFRATNLQSQNSKNAESPFSKSKETGSGEVHRPSEVLTRRSRVESTRSHTPKPSERLSHGVYTSVSKTSKNVESSKKKGQPPIHVSSEEDFRPTNLQSQHSKSAESPFSKSKKTGSGEVHRPSEVLPRRSRPESAKSHTPKPSERPSRGVYTSVSKTSKNVLSKKQSEAPIHVSSEEDFRATNLQSQHSKSAESPFSNSKETGSGEVHRPSEVLTRRSRPESTRSHTPKPSERPSRSVYASVSKITKNVVSSKKKAEAPIHVSPEKDFRPTNLQSQHSKSVESLFSKSKKTVKRDNNAPDMKSTTAATSDYYESEPTCRGSSNLTKITARSRPESTRSHTPKPSERPSRSVNMKSTTPATSEYYVSQPSTSRGSSKLTKITAPARNAKPGRHIISENRTSEVFDDDQPQKSLNEIMKESSAGGIGWTDVIPETRAVLNASTSTFADISADPTPDCLHGSEEPRAKAKARSIQLLKTTMKSPMVTVIIPRRITRSQLSRQKLNASTPLLHKQIEREATTTRKTFDNESTSKNAAKQRLRNQKKINDLSSKKRPIKVGKSTALKVLNIDPRPGGLEAARSDQGVTKSKSSRNIRKKKVELPLPFEDVDEAEVSLPFEDVEEVEVLLPSEDVEEAEVPLPFEDVDEAEVPLPSEDVEEAEVPLPSEDVEEVEAVLPLPFEYVEEAVESVDYDDSVFQPIETVRDAEPVVQSNLMPSPERLLPPRRRSIGMRLVTDTSENEQGPSEKRKKRPRVAFGDEIASDKRKDRYHTRDKCKKQKRMKKARLFELTSDSASAVSSDLSWIKDYEIKKTKTPKLMKTFKGRKNLTLSFPTMDKLTREQVWSGSTSSPGSPEVARSDITNHPVLRGISRLQGYVSDIAFDDADDIMSQEKSEFKSNDENLSDVQQSVAEVSQINLSVWDSVPVDEMCSFLSDDDHAPRKGFVDAETNPKEPFSPLTLEVARSNNQTPVDTVDRSEVRKEAKRKPEKRKADESPAESRTRLEKTHFKSKKKLHMRSSDAEPSPPSPHHSGLESSASNHLEELSKQMIKVVGKYMKQANKHWNVVNAERDHHLQEFQGKAIQSENLHNKLIRKLSSLEAEANCFVEKFNGEIQTVMAEAASNAVEAKSMHSDLIRNLAQSNDDQNKRMERLRNEISNDLRRMVQNTE